MTENSNEETTVNEDKKDYARRWGIVGLGVALTTVLVAKAFSSDDSEDEGVVFDHVDGDGNVATLHVTEENSTEEV